MAPAIVLRKALAFGDPWPQVDTRLVVIAELRLPAFGQTGYRRYLEGCTQILREVRTGEEPDFDMETLSRLLFGVVDGLMLQWLSLDDPPAGIWAEESARMLQNALPTMKYEPGLAARR
ncbi:hypothetical protein [Pseudarthrobacter sp. S9]|uniref:hypothetical protein n=1 Tax=Pseudarthrobacter sp. S9 TaxID=3418421 RepID=UPI003CFF6F11